MLTYAERAKFTNNRSAQDLFQLMDRKKSNLAVAADVTTKSELLHLADQIGPEVCLLKTHIDIISDFDQDLVNQLIELSQKHDFHIFEDRKFADIGNTVKHQYEGGVYRIADWAHMINAHTLPGPGIIQGLKEPGLKQGRGLLLLAEMSSSGNLLDAFYAQKTVEMADQHADFVMGFISQSQVSSNPAFIHMTPGVHMAAQGDPLGQQYQSPEDVILKRNCDVIIVGRGICQAPNFREAAGQYRQAGWDAYLKKLQINNI